MVRRREASRKTRSSLSERLAQEAKPSLSKSSVRRQKQRAREQLAGNREGLQSMTAVVTSMEATMEPVPREQTRASHSKNTARSRRAMLYVYPLTPGSASGSGSHTSSPTCSAKRIRLRRSVYTCATRWTSRRAPCARWTKP